MGSGERGFRQELAGHCRVIRRVSGNREAERVIVNCIVV